METSSEDSEFDIDLNSDEVVIASILHADGHCEQVITDYSKCTNEELLELAKESPELLPMYMKRILK